MIELPRMPAKERLRDTLRIEVRQGGLPPRQNLERRHIQDLIDNGWSRLEIKYELESFLGMTDAEMLVQDLDSYEWPE